MAFATGTRLGNYEVIDLLGAGGMGEVYRARDTKLGRDVALKVLPTHLATNRERLDRFEREARLLASLNHPNVATLHGLEEHDGMTFLVMELVEGETLAARIARGALGWREALPLFEQVAEGLAAAHDKAVIHRDLKPPNIMITADGKVKLLDFGLAKAFGPEIPGVASPESPTLTRDGTATGVILGTAAYMSPEQARGRSVDKRTDIWAFGCCLFESLTGKPAFLGETISDTIAAILEREPDWSALPSPVPTRVRYLLQRTLSKDTRERIHDIADARILLEDQQEAEATVSPSVGPKAALIVLSLIALVATAVAVWTLLNEDVTGERHVTRSRLHLEEGNGLMRRDAPSVAISPDGQHIAYVARGDNTTHLYIRSLSEATAQRVRDSDGALGPFFSDDSRQIAFRANGSLHRVPVSGGAPTVLAAVHAGHGATWLPSGEIVFAPWGDTGLVRIHPETGEREAITEPNRAEREKGHRLPDALPGGKAILFTSTAIDITSYDDGTIRVLDLETGEIETLIDGGTCARYSASGHIVYFREGTLFAAPFDADALRLTGAPVPVQTGVTVAPFAGAEFAIADNGTLVFAPGGPASQNNRIVWIDRQGHKEPLDFNAPSTGELTHVTLSPDEDLLAVGIWGATDHIWIYDIARGSPMRLTFEWDNSSPAWAPHGGRIAFSSNRNGQFNLYMTTVGASGDAERLTTSPYRQTAGSWFPDGRTLIYHETHPETARPLASAARWRPCPGTIPADAVQRMERPRLSGRAFRRV